MLDMMPCAVKRNADILSFNQTKQRNPPDIKLSLLLWAKWDKLVLLWPASCYKVEWHCAWKPDTRHFQTSPPSPAHVSCLLGWFAAVSLIRNEEAFRASPAPFPLFTLSEPFHTCAGGESQHFVWDVLRHACSDDGGREDEEDEEEWRAAEERRWLAGAVQERGGAESCGLPAKTWRERRAPTYTPTPTPSEAHRRLLQGAIKISCGKSLITLMRFVFSIITL